MLVFAAAPTFLGCRERGRPLVAVRGLPIVGPLVAEHRLRGAWTSVAAVLGLWSTDSGAGAHGLRCSAACGVLPARGSSPGIESVAPALAGGFCTTEPLGCPWSSLAVKDSGFGRCFQARLCFLTFSLCVSSLLPRFPGASVYQLGSQAAGPGPWGLRDHRGTWGRFWTRDPFWASVLPWWAFPAWPLLPCWTSATGAFFSL